MIYPIISHLQNALATFNPLSGLCSNSAIPFSLPENQGLLILFINDVKKFYSMPVHLEVKPIHVRVKSIHLDMKAIHVRVKSMHFHIKSFHQRMKGIHCRVKSMHFRMPSIHFLMNRIHCWVKSIHRQLKPVQSRMKCLYASIKSMHLSVYPNRLKVKSGPSRSLEPFMHPLPKEVCLHSGNCHPPWKKRASPNCLLQSIRST